MASIQRRPPDTLPRHSREPPAPPRLPALTHAPLLQAAGIDVLGVFVARFVGLVLKYLRAHRNIANGLLAASRSSRFSGLILRAKGVKRDLEAHRPSFVRV